MAIGTSGLSVPQLSQGIDSSIYGNKEAPKGMSLSDIVDLSRTSIALQKEKALLQPAIEAGQATARQAVTQADTAQLENTLKHATVATQNIQQLLTKTDLSSNDVVEMVKKTADTHGGSPQSIQQALMGLPENGSPTQIKAWLAQNLTKTLTTQAQLEKLYPGGVLPGQLPSSYKPETQEQPKTTAQEPFSQPEKLSYPVPQAGQPRSQNPSEEGDRIVGEKYRQELKPIQNQYGALKQNYDKLINQAEKVAGDTIFGGPAGTAERTLRAKIGTPEYQQLSKDLAKAQIADIQANGGDMAGVAGQQLLAHANGQITYDPKVLIDMARRNAATLEKKNSESYGADQANSKFGDANVNRKFRTEWNKNANDNSVFEMQYIFKSARTPEEGAAKVAKYIKENEHTPAKRKELATKYLNLQKLQNEGSL